MIVTLQPSPISGSVRAPASKSAMQRACAAALLSKGKWTIHNAGTSNDDRAAMDIISRLGASVSLADRELVVESRGVDPLAGEIDCGESGLSIRMFTPVAALSDRQITVTGSGSLASRPMDFFDTVLPELGVQVTSDNGKLPLVIRGPLQPANIIIDGSLSSQFLTGLLMAYSAANAQDVTITVTNLASRPYIDLTLAIMQRFGLQVPATENYEHFHFNKAVVDKRDTGGSYTVEGDWSGGAFLLVAGAIAGDVDVQGLQNTSTQADKRIVDALLDAGADVTVGSDNVRVHRNKLEPFSFDATDCPDLFPPLVALASHCPGMSRIRGLKRLKFKESDRGLALREEFEKLGTEIRLEGDEMLVYGNEKMRIVNHTLNSHHDHRIAMACVTAALAADVEVQVRHAEAINKSYPAFYDDMRQLGAVITISEKQNGLSLKY